MPSSDDQEPTPTGPNDASGDGESHDAQPLEYDVLSPDPTVPGPAEARPADGDLLVESEAVRRRWHKHPVLRILMRIVVAIAGVLLGILIGGHTTADIGPIKVSADLLIGSGNTTLHIPPLGALEV